MYIFTPFTNVLPENNPFKVFEDWMKVGDSVLRGTAFPNAATRVEENEAVVDLEVPGVDPDAITLSMEKNTLRVEGPVPERHLPSEAAEEAKTFSRTFELPFPVDEEHIEAKYALGVLSIRLPKVKETATRKITIIK